LLANQIGKCHAEFNRCERVTSHIACPDCRHRLTLPEAFLGKRVQCPKCGFEFEAAEAPVPALEVETPGAAAQPNASTGPSPKSGAASPNPHGAYVPFNGPVAKPAPTIVCTECGARFRRDAESCPVCGFQTDLMLGEPLDRRRPRRHIMQPVSNVLPIVTAILIPAGMVLLIGIPIVDEIFRGDVEDLLIGLICFTTGSVELAAIICGCTWLYQAWRAVLRGDEDYPPGLMVG
jgi:DNA-directed RNA polymerase subunit RPC12/RpoP